MAKQKQIIFKSKDIESSNVFYMASHFIEKLKKFKEIVVVGMNSSIKNNINIIAVDFVINSETQKQEQSLLQKVEKLLMCEQKKDKTVEVKI